MLFRTINSANQLSIYGAIANWCVAEQLYRKLEHEEANTLVQAPDTNVQAARDRCVITKSFSVFFKRDKSISDL